MKEEIEEMKKTLDWLDEYRSEQSSEEDIAMLTNAKFILAKDIYIYSRGDISPETSIKKATHFIEKFKEYDNKS